MKGFLAVARREIEEKRFVFLAAAVASLAPLAVPIVRGMRGAHAAEVRDWAAVVGAATLGAALAIALGSTTIATDLAERRLGFYFSRPISGFALWAGKLGAACLLALATAAIVYLPTLATNGGRVILLDLPRQSPLIFVGGVAAVVLLMHAGNILMRPRSPLLAFDMAALVVLSLAVIFIAQRFFRAFALEAIQTATRGLLVVTGVALLVAGLLAVLHGRSDSRAAHRALSATLWGILAAGVVAMAGYGEWVFSVSPQNLSKISFVKPAPKGSWVALAGEARGWEPTFLFDTATGRFQRTGAYWRQARISPDGALGVWFEPSGEGLFDIVTWKLDDAASRPVRTKLSLPGVQDLFLSEHGERLATISGGVLSVWDLKTGAGLGSARVGDEHSFTPGFFFDAKRIRIRRFNSSESQTQVLEFDIPTKTLATIAVVKGVDAVAALLANTSGDRMLVREKSRITLREGNTGAVIATLSERGPTSQAFARFVSDGRIAVAVSEGPTDSKVQERKRTVRVEVFTHDGRLERTIAIPGQAAITLGGEAAPGKLVVAAGRDSNDQRSRTIFLADLSTGDVRRVADGLFPVAYAWWYIPGYYQPEPGEEATKLFFGPGRSLVHFDPLTGERRLILGKTDSR